MQKQIRKQKTVELINFFKQQNTKSTKQKPYFGEKREVKFIKLGGRMEIKVDSEMFKNTKYLDDMMK